MRLAAPLPPFNHSPLCSSVFTTLPSIRETLVFTCTEPTEKNCFLVEFVRTPPRDQHAQEKGTRNRRRREGGAPEEISSVISETGPTQAGTKGEEGGKEKAVNDKKEDKKTKKAKENAEAEANEENHSENGDAKTNEVEAAPEEAKEEAKSE